jgi:adenylate cyclase
MAVSDGIDFVAEGLLDGLEGEQRLERVALLEQLITDGVPLTELRRRTVEGTILFLPAERVIGGSKRYTAAEVAERTGVDLDFLTKVRHAMGLSIPGPDEAEYIEADIEALQMAKLAKQEGISDEEIIDLMRTLGRGLSQAAETMRKLPLSLILEPGLSEQELAQRYAQRASQLYPMLGPVVNNLLTLHLRQVAQSEMINALERRVGKLPDARDITVCFADLVGFTRRGEDVPPDELGRLAARLEALASEVVEPPVKLVKTIGDAVMLVSPQPEPLLDATLTLIDAANIEGPEFPQLRAGVAKGEAIAQAGDWYGRKVNLASRITAIAWPGSVLAERAVRDAARERYHWSNAGERRVRGVHGPVALFRARPAVAPKESPTGHARGSAARGSSSTTPSL